MTVLYPQGLQGEQGIPPGCCVGWVAVTNALHVFLQAWPDLLLQGILGEILLHAEAAENSPLL